MFRSLRLLAVALGRSRWWLETATFFFRRYRWGTLCHDLYVAVSAAVASVATRWGYDLAPRWWLSIMATQLRTASATLAYWEHAIRILEEILHFKSNSSPVGVYLPRYYPYTELLWVLYNIHTRSKNFCVLCTTLIPVPGTSVRSVWPCHNNRGMGKTFLDLARNFSKFSTSVPQYPELLEGLLYFHTRTWTFCKLCNTFMPVPGISVSSVRPVLQYPEIRVHLILYLPRTFVSFVRPCHKYPELR